jgi:hypothetical protein
LTLGGAPLASWKDGPAKQAILDFIDATTGQRARILFRRESASALSTKTVGQ